MWDSRFYVDPLFTEFTLRFGSQLKWINHELELGFSGMEMSGSLAHGIEVNRRRDSGLDAVVVWMIDYLKNCHWQRIELIKVFD